MEIDRNQAVFLAAAIIRKYEGLRLAPYFCPAGRLTIGYGHVILPGESSLRAGISEGLADELLLRDIAWALFEVRRVGRKLADFQEAALCSLVFNIGRAAWQKSTIRALVASGDFSGAAAQFGRWINADGVVQPGLVKRRYFERMTFEGKSWIG